MTRQREQVVWTDGAFVIAWDERTAQLVMGWKGDCMRFVCDRVTAARIAEAVYTASMLT